ncbi:hypothetical protein [Massilia sp. Leaf139]|uniref:hypothetical protein n=1 Tax=Massilia sp. Leaf139 TaxID=1736272 RepID=UPI0006FC6491|nr:hypothetical protein [Massilia sp. Leaf139]KQQ87014.1 hypothetical protein ASF77_15455 [Massilia sp. Leaf139]
MHAEPRSVAIIASREDVATLKNCIDSVIRACKGKNVAIDILVNGNERLAQDITETPFDNRPPCQLRFWSIKQGDKAHAWNEYVHRIWPGQGDAFFLDGYVEIEENALDALKRTLTASPEALAASGIPSSGRSAASTRAIMLREGGFQGNLHVLSKQAMQQLRDSGFRLPLGLYRTDSVTSSLLMFRLDPASNVWDKKNIVVAPEATWTVRGLGRLTYKSIVGQWKRILRQAQGELESRAVREHLVVRRHPPHLIATTVQTLVGRWIAEQPAQARQLFRKNPLCAYAAWCLRAPRDWSAAAVSPRMVAVLGATERRRTPRAA